MASQTQLAPAKPLGVSSPIAACLLDSTDASLEKDRATGHMGVPYVKAGRRVIYRLSDLEEWLNANRIIPRPANTGGKS